MQNAYPYFICKYVRAELYHNFLAGMIGRDRYNEPFWEMYRWLEKTNSWSLKQFREFQMMQLQKQINHAYHHTRYYRRLFDEHGWKPQDFHDFQDFRKIPIITKNDLKMYLEELRALPRRKCYLVTTGGSTGIPTPIYHEMNRTGETYRAFVWQWYNEGDYYPGDRAAILRGSVIEKGCYEFLKNTGELHCSSMKMTERNMKDYLFHMEECGVKAICAYPSSAELLAKYIESTNFPFNENGRIKSLFTSSESLTDDVRKLVEEKLHLRVYDLYGNSEQMGMIGQLRDGMYHEYMCHSYVEYLDENNRPVKNGKGRIIATGFINDAMPLLRYDTDDFAEITDNMPLKRYSAQKVVEKIYGRRKKEELIVGSNGNMVNIVAINSHADIFRNIYKLQFVQEEKGKVILNVMPNQNFKRVDYEQIQQEFEKRLGEMFELKLIVTDQFEYTARGKEKLLVQRLKI